METKTYYLGLGVTFHDPAIAIVDELGEPLFAEASERYLQAKRALNADPDPYFRLAELLQTYCQDADRFVIASNWHKRRPWYERLAHRAGWLSAPKLDSKGLKRLGSPIGNHQIHHMMACNHLSIAGGGLNLSRLLKDLYPQGKVEYQFFNHHDTHAACACYASPFDDSACAVFDSYGEQGSLAFYHYQGGRLHKLQEVKGLGSLGLFYMYLTELCGFDWMKGEEWKVMGLAPYGQVDSHLLNLFRTMLVAEGLSLKHPQQTLFQTLEELEAVRRNPAKPVESVANLAQTGQAFFAELVSQLLTEFHVRCPERHLTLAGGCALNSSLNGQIASKTPYRELFIPPAPADDGAALGAAWLAFRQDQSGFGFPRSPSLLSPYLGSEICPEALSRLVRFGGLNYRYLPQTLCEETAKLLAQGKLIGWMQGRAEFGPRALGNRSILADPRSATMKETLNSRVKFREEYRPFAPSILHEYGPEYFEDYQVSPYMERALKFRQAVQDRVPAVVHVDGTGRLQTVKAEWNPRFHRLISAFHQLTGVPILLNTSFNVMGKPIIHSVEDAVAVYLTSGLDAMVIGDFLFEKPPAHG